jgi:hypothetical protein
MAMLGVVLASVVFRRLDPANATWWVGVEADDPADPVTEVSTQRQGRRVAQTLVWWKDGWMEGLTAGAAQNATAGPLSTVRPR